ncbi:MAG: alcohol dehydrogenase catalytic domain-containing protein [Treponema sp.]|jgi:threonine dehydrogenase-like Zn-dependent dehydrogenase|nr:alcohol dehydrogenase catalytic domain-containing protein [Treponema sp.]
MKAIVKYAHGKGNYELRDVPEPSLGDEDVLIEVKAAGLCASDLDFAEGRQAGALHPPVILGHEFAGVVAKVGKNVTKWKPGDPAVSDNTGTVCGECYACSTGNYLACPDRLGLGYGMDGGFTKYCRIPGNTLRVFPNALLRIPGGISFEEAAILDPACNAYRAVVHEARLIPGEHIAVFGVGALGQFAIQSARAAGAAKIIAVGLAQDKDRFKLAEENGATDFVMADDGDSIVKVRDLTGGEGPAAVVDCAGANIVLKQAIEMVRMSGVVVKVGYDIRPVDFSMDRIIERAVTIKGHFGYDWVAWKNIMNLVLAGKFSLKSVISHRMTIADFDSALNLLRGKQAVKVILYPLD